MHAEEAFIHSTFNGKENPPKSPGGKAKTPEGAPFGATLDKEYSFIPEIGLVCN